MYGLLHVYYRTNRMRDKTGGSYAGQIAEREKARKGGSIRYDYIFKA